MRILGRDSVLSRNFGFLGSLHDDNNGPHAARSVKSHGNQDGRKEGVLFAKLDVGPLPR
jgi:hypothetical protein